MPNEPITIEATINAPIEKVWQYWTTPQHINNWAFASDDWEARESTNDLQIGGSFKTVMASKETGEGFDFTGKYTDVVNHTVIAYDMHDGRHVSITFTEVPNGVHIVQQFDPENENPREMQQEGWQTILNNFKLYTERN